MDTVTVLAERRQELVTPRATATIDATRTLAVTATYLLSEDGRKASLLAGGDGRAVQQLTVNVPTSRLHLVSVDADGIARLKLRPRYQLNEEQRVVRIDAPPTYDVPPDLEDLFREAARNHQLERTYETERRTAKVKRREADRERRAQIAKTFLGDQTQRALVHPAPTPKRCWLDTDKGRVVFDTNLDDGPARDVPPEAHRRFRTDLRARRDDNLRQRSEQLALHEEKKRYIADWISANGTAEQRARQAAGVLPIDEAIEAIADEAFASLSDLRRYEYDGVARLQEHARRVGCSPDVVVTQDDLVVTSTEVKQMTAAQFALANEIQTKVPGATVTLRTHKVALKREPKIALPPMFSMVVTIRKEPFTLRRQYLSP